MKVIETTGQLNDFCTSLAKQEFITVDLEFHREKTYYAKLGLIQVACPGHSARLCGRSRPGAGPSRPVGHRAGLPESPRRRQL